MRRPNFSMRGFITSGRPIRIGFASAFVHDHLHRAQHALVLAFAEDDALRIAAWPREHRLHDQAGVVDELRQLLAVRVEIRDRTRRHAAVHRRLRHRRRDLHDQARIERLGNQVLGAEATGPARRRRWPRYRTARPAPARRWRARRRASSRSVMRGGADVERAAEDEREAQHVVDLVRDSPSGRWR